MHRTFAHLGEYACPLCGNARPKLDVAVTGVGAKQEKSCEITVRIHGEELTLPVNIRAGYDIYNAAAALAGLVTLGLSVEQAANALGHFTHAAHRFEIFNIDGAPARLLLMKNTAGANQLVNMIASEGELPRNFVFMLGNEIMDGIYTDWIEGVRFEKLIGPETRAIVGGPCHEDMRARLLAAGLPDERMHVQTDYAALVREIVEAGEPVTVIANCSTIEALRLELVKKYQPVDYWAE